MLRGKPFAIEYPVVSGKAALYQSDIKHVMKLLRDSDRAVKARIEQERCQFMDHNSSKENLQARQRYLQETYVPRLQKLGSTFEDMGALLPSFLMIVPVAANHYRVFSQEDSNTVLCNIYLNDLAFDQLPPDAHHPRPVYIKKFSGGKQYVKDSKGFYVRRFAWCEKSFLQFIFLLELSEIHGRFAYKDKLNFLKDPYLQPPGDTSGKLPPSAISIQPDDQKRGDDLRRRFAGPLAPLSQPGGSVPKKYDVQPTDVLTRDQIAFLQVEDGTTLGQRANSLGSSGRKLHSNHGTIFTQTEGVLLELDLSCIGFENDQFLLNLYSCEAVEDFDGGLADKPAKERTRSAEEAQEHFLYSVRKNREIVLQKICLTAITKIGFYSNALYSAWQVEVRERFLRAGNPGVVLCPFAFSAERELNSFAEHHRIPRTGTSAASDAKLGRLPY